MAQKYLFTLVESDTCLRTQQAANTKQNIVMGMPKIGMHEDIDLKQKVALDKRIDCPGEWGSWGPCSMGCHGGFQARTYIVPAAASKVCHAAGVFFEICRHPNAQLCTPELYLFFCLFILLFLAVVFCFYFFP